MIKKEIFFTEAEAADAPAFIAFMNQVATETDFLVMDDTGFRLSRQEMEAIFEANLSNPRQLCLLAKCGEEVIGAINVKTASPSRINHIGGIFLAVRKDYWGHGLGSILLEEVLAWAEEGQVLGRLELTVQIRNERAVQLYQKVGFEIEGIQRRGARTDAGEWLDLYYMGKLIGDK